MAEPDADHSFEKRLRDGLEIVWGAPAPELVTERLRLQPVAPEHAEELWPLLDDVRLHRFTGGRPLSLSELRRRFARQALGCSPDGGERWCTWIVRERATAAATGFVQATVPSGAPRSAELAWTIATAFQHRGYAREAAGAVVGWLRVHGVEELSALIHPDHAASGAVARAIGLSPTADVVDGEVRWGGPSLQAVAPRPHEQETRAMKIALFGPTGMIGSRIGAELSARGHEIAGASRATGTDITDPGAVATAVAGADAVVCAIAARGVDYTLTDVARSLVDGLRQAGVSRLLVVGGAGSLLVAPGRRLLDTPEFPDDYKAEATQAADALEFLRSVDDLDWTYVSPAAYIHPGERTGAYRLGGDQLLVDEHGTSEISAEDYAIAIADLVEQGGHARERVTAAW